MGNTSGEDCFANSPHAQHRYHPATVRGDPLLHLRTFLLTSIKIYNVGYFSPILMGKRAWNGILLFVHQPHLHRCLVEDGTDLITVQMTRKALPILPSTNSFGVHSDFFCQLCLR